MSAFAEHVYSGQTIIVAGSIGDDWFRLVSFESMRNAHLALLVDLERRQIDVLKDRGVSNVHMAALIDQFPSAARHNADHNDLLEPDVDDLVLIRLFARN